MQNLKTNMTAVGYSDVLTYLNSGNVVFSVPEARESILANTIMAESRK